MEIRGTEKMKNITKEEMNIKEFFEKYPNVAIALSGGVDSVFLVYMAKKYAKSVKAYFVKSVFQPEFEKKDAEKICRQLGVDLKILNVDVLSNKLVTDNPVNRCYYCKQGVFGTILEAAKNDGITVILDGTNASDDADDRPGMKALQEMKVLSPLRMCGYVKSEIRKQSKEAGLFV